MDPNDPYAEKEIFPPHPSLNASPVNTPQRRAIQQAKAARTRRLSSAVSESPTSYTVFPDIEDYDPTYGLRPEGVPTHSGYEAFGRLWEKARQGEGRGFGSLMQSRVEEERTGDVSDDDFDNDDLDIDLEVDHDTLSPLQATSPRLEDSVEWETFPAVGGGVISRPRVYHSQSKIRAPSESGAMPSPGGTGSITARASSIGASSTIGVSLLFPVMANADMFRAYGNSQINLQHRTLDKHKQALAHHHYVESQPPGQTFSLLKLNIVPPVPKSHRQCRNHNHTATSPNLKLQINAQTPVDHGVQITLLGLILSLPTLRHNFHLLNRVQCLFHLLNNMGGVCR